MADTTIEWATKVWNVTRGCRRVSPGCGGPHNEGGCYAEHQAMRMSNPGGAYEGLVQLTPRGPRWTGKGRFAVDKLAEPLQWRAPRDGSRHRIFVNSMSDLFFEEFSNEQIASVFGVMAACPQHDFLVLTKRAERMREWFDWLGAPERPGAGFPLHVQRLAQHSQAVGVPVAIASIEWPLPNVHLGVSCEDQQRADERIPHLLATPAAVRWVSAEPLLGPLDLSRFMWPMCWHWSAQFKTPEEAIAAGAYAEQKRQSLVSAHAVFLDWVVVGGESGPGARDCDVAWVEAILKQCRKSGVPAFCKQLGARPVFRSPLERVAFFDKGSADAHGAEVGRIYGPGHGELIRTGGLRHPKGGDPSEWPESLRVRQFPEARS